MAALATAVDVGAEDIDFGAEAQARGMELISCSRVRGGNYHLQPCVWCFTFW